MRYRRILSLAAIPLLSALASGQTAAPQGGKGTAQGQATGGQANSTPPAGTGQPLSAGQPQKTGNGQSLGAGTTQTNGAGQNLGTGQSTGVGQGLGQPKATGNGQSLGAGTTQTNGAGQNLGTGQNNGTGPLNGAGTGQTNPAGQTNATGQTNGTGQNPGTGQNNAQPPGTGTANGQGNGNSLGLNQPGQSAAAQQAMRTPNQNMQSPNLPSALLNNPAIAQTLGLNPNQAAQLGQLTQQQQERYRQDYAGLANLNQDQRYARQQELNARYMTDWYKNAGGVFNPAQLERHRQLMVQDGGFNAFHDPQLQSRLNLTDAQRRDVRQWADWSDSRMTEIRQTAQSNPEMARREYAEYRKTLQERINGYLTPDQQKEYAALTGEPYNFPFPATQTGTTATTTTQNGTQPIQVNTQMQQSGAAFPLQTLPANPSFDFSRRQE